MNQLENKMVDVLQDLKENYGALYVKTEFEAEGTHIEEVLKLKDICNRSGLGLTLKIGGCEAVRDMLESRVIGVNCLSAPMIESAYALKKYLMAVAKVFPEDELATIEVEGNVETKAGVDEFDKMMELKNISLLSGIAVERIDLCRSFKMSEVAINDAFINDIVADVCKRAKEKGLITTVAGGVSATSLPFFISIAPILDRYETRKVCFEAPKALSHCPEKGILKALGFELLWLHNKSDFYKGISDADRHRIRLLEENYIKDMGNI